jgi:hypothetical protein
MYQNQNSNIRIQKNFIGFRILYKKIDFPISKTSRGFKVFVIY